MWDGHRYVSMRAAKIAARSRVSPSWTGMQTVPRIAGVIR